MSKRTSRRSSSTTVSVSQASSRAVEFNPDYSYVKSDLRRTGLLAGIFTVALIILSFIIP